MVTGGTDGIGLEICNQMAEMGFNICIVARDEKKLKQVTLGLQKRFKVQTKEIVCDLASVRSVHEYQLAVANKVAGLDISVVFINAGVSTPGTF